MGDRNTGYDAAEHETFGFIDDEQPNEEGLEEAVLDADDYQERGTTPLEERHGTPIDERLAAEVPENADPDRRDEPETMAPDESADPDHPDPVAPAQDEPLDPHEPEQDRPETGAPEVDESRPLPDIPVPPRP